VHSAQRALTVWKHIPGNWDPLHSRDTFPSDNTYGIPTIERNAHHIPKRLIGWGSRPQLLAAAGQDMAVHFFLDDYRFESLWKDPLRNLDALLGIGQVLSPDFSLWRNMPYAMQQWNVYRSRWLGCYWQSYGLSVIPTISWSEPYDFCYVGVPTGSIVAIATVGLRDQVARHLFRAGFERMIEIIQPSAILSYGRLPPDVQTDIPTTIYPTRWDDFHARATCQQRPVSVELCQCIET
jgi:hypothetical protein